MSQIKAKAVIEAVKADLEAEDRIDLLEWVVGEEERNVVSFRSYVNGLIEQVERERQPPIQSVEQKEPTKDLIALPYLKKLIDTAEANPEWGTGSPAARVLKRLFRSVELGEIDPFSINDLWDYLKERDVPSEEVTLLQRVPLPVSPKRKKPFTFNEALSAFERDAGKSIILSGINATDNHLAPALLAATSAILRLPRRAAYLWQSEVKKVRLRGSSRGSEDASWEHGNVLSLVLTKTTSVPSWVFTVTHELGHALEERIGLMVTPWDETPYGNPPFVSSYAEKNATEDFAETFRALDMEPKYLKRIAPGKYKDMQSRTSGLLSSALTLDSETGQTTRSEKKKSR